MAKQEQLEDYMPDFVSTDNFERLWKERNSHRIVNRPWDSMGNLRRHNE